MNRIEIFLRNTTGHKVPLHYKKKWKTVFDSFDDIYSIPYIIFLGETLTVLTGESSLFSGYKKTITGIGEERWDVTAGYARIYRELITELTDNWQRVEVLSDRLEITGIDEILEWNGEYTAFGGTTVKLSNISSEQKNQIKELAEKLCSETKIKIC